MEVEKSKISERSAADRVEASCNLQKEDDSSHVLPFPPRLHDRHQSFAKGARKPESKEVPEKCERAPQSKKEDLQQRVLKENPTQADGSVDTPDFRPPARQSSTFSIPLPVDENASKLRRVQVKGKRLAESDHELKSTNRKQSRIDDVHEPPTKSKEQSSTLEKSMDTRPEFQENRLKQIRSKIDQYKCELKKYEDILKPTLQTCGELFQKYTEVEDQKQSKIKEFHRFYRKVNDILWRQSRLEERLELVSGFLDNKSKVKKILCDSIMVDNGAKFRQTLELLENYHNKMNVIQQRVQQSMTALQKYEVEISILHEREESEPRMNLDRHVALCLEKANFMLNKSNNIRAEMKELEFSITRDKMNVNSEQNQIKANIIAKFEKAQSELGILRHEKSTMKNRVMKEIFAQKRMISELHEKLNRKKTKSEQAVAEKCDLEKEIEELSEKEEETNKKLSNIELKFNELNDSMARMKLYNQEKAKRESDIRSLMEIKMKELQDLKEKLLSRESEKNLLMKKIKHYQSFDDKKKMFLQLQNKLSFHIEQKQKVVETIATLIQEQETKESHIRALELERSAVDERIQKFQEISASHSSQWQGLKFQVDILETISLVKGDEISSCNAKEQELSSFYSDIHETLFLLTELELQVEQLRDENDKIEVTNQRKQKELEKILDEIAKLSNHEKTIKLLVKEGRYTTKQELNKNQSQIMKWKEDEEMKIKVLKEELQKDKTELEARIKYYEENNLQPNQLDVEKSEEKKLPE